MLSPKFRGWDEGISLCSSLLCLTAPTHRSTVEFKIERCSDEEWHAVQSVSDNQLVQFVRYVSVAIPGVVEI